MNLRVAIVTESFLPSLNGVTSSVIRVLDSLREKGHEAIVIAPTSVAREYRGFRVVKTAALPLMQFNLGVPNPWLANELSQFAPDVIHVASPFALGGQALAIAERSGIPTVAVYQTDVAGYMERYRLAALKPMLDRVTKMIHGPATLNLAPTSDSQSYLRSLGLDRVDVWGRGVDLNQFHPNRRFADATKALRDEWAPSGELVVGYVGRLAAEKQVHRMEQLFGKFDGVRFVIVGDGPERRSLEQRFAGKGVTFAGAMRGDALGHAYAAFDVFVHFGTEETFGQTIQEAQAAGVPVVAPASGGPLHLIHDGDNGFLFDPTALDGSVGAVGQLIGDPAIRSRVGESGRRSVLAKSWEVNNDKLIGHYRRAMAIHSQRKFTTLASA